MRTHSHLFLRALLLGLVVGVMPVSGQSELLQGGHAKAEAVAAKAAKQAGKASAKQAKKLAKLHVLRDARQAALSLITADQQGLVVVLGQQTAELAAAEALPDDDPGKAAALLAAQKALKATEQTLGKLAKQAGRLVKQLAKIAQKIHKTGAKLSTAQQQVEQAASDLDALAMPFAFGGFESRELDVTVVGPAGPLAGTFVSVHSPLVPPKGGKWVLDDLSLAGPWFSGRTDDAGRLQATVSLPAALTELDVTLHAAGLSGDYSHESLRDAYGAFAPSARVLVSRQELDALSFTLWPTPELLELAP